MSKGIIFEISEIEKTKKNVIMNSRKFFGNFIIALLGGIVAVAVYATMVEKETVVVTESSTPMTQMTGLTNPFDPTNIDFSYAAEKTVDAVVHVTTVIPGREYSVYDLWRGRKRTESEPDRSGSGSGVIISSKGHIVTNNHVVENSKALKVKLNDGRTYVAELVGADPDTDLAVIKIDEKDLPYIVFGDSDELKIGAWVLAVGNPYNLYSTVTAGIVSAKARDLDLLGRGSKINTGIEAYIQTDAAVNMGNSGGALVNLRGELVGINSAIASYTGTFAGYSFAVPVSIARKVVEDLIEFGEVHRPVLGISIQTVTETIAEEYNIDKIEGVRISTITEDGPAQKAGLNIGDIILKVNDIAVNSNSELLEKINSHNPGEEINLQIKTGKKIKSFDITLEKRDPDAGTIYASDYLGAKFEKPSDRELYRMDLNYGVKVTDLRDGILKEIGIKEGFIIVQINDKAVREIDDISRLCDEAEEKVIIEGYYPRIGYKFYGFKK